MAAGDGTLRIMHCSLSDSLQSSNYREKVQGNASRYNITFVDDDPKDQDALSGYQKPRSTHTGRRTAFHDSFSDSLQSSNYLETVQGNASRFDIIIVDGDPKDQDTLSGYQKPRSTHTGRRTAFHARDCIECNYKIFSLPRAEKSVGPRPGCGTHIEIKSKINGEMQTFYIVTLCHSYVDYQYVYQRLERLSNHPTVVIFDFVKDLLIEDAMKSIGYKHLVKQSYCHREKGRFTQYFFRASDGGKWDYPSLEFIDRYTIGISIDHVYTSPGMASQQTEPHDLMMVMKTDLALAPRNYTTAFSSSLELAVEECPQESEDEETSRPISSLSKPEAAEATQEKLSKQDTKAVDKQPVVQTFDEAGEGTSKAKDKLMVELEIGQKYSPVERDDDESKEKLHKAIKGMMENRKQTKYEITHLPDDKHKVTVHHCDDSNNIRRASKVVKKKFPEYELHFAKWDSAGFGLVHPVTHTYSMKGPLVHPSDQKPSKKTTETKPLVTGTKEGSALVAIDGEGQKNLWEAIARMMDKRKQRNCEIRHHPDDHHKVFVYLEDDPEKIKEATEEIKRAFPEYEISFVDWEDDESDDKLHRAIDRMMDKRKQRNCEIRHHPDDHHKVFVYLEDDPEKIKEATEEIKRAFPEYEISFVDWEDDESDDRLHRAIDSIMKKTNYEICHHPDKRYKVSVYHGSEFQEIEDDSKKIVKDFPAYELTFLTSKHAGRGFTTLLNEYVQPLTIKDRQTMKKGTVDLMLDIVEENGIKYPVAATAAHVVMYGEPSESLCRGGEVVLGHPDPQDVWKFYDHKTGLVSYSDTIPFISFQMLRTKANMTTMTRRDLLRDIALFPLAENGRVTGNPPTNACTYISGESFGRIPIKPLKFSVKGVLTVKNLSLPAIRKALCPKYQKIKVVIGGTVGKLTGINPYEEWRETEHCLLFYIETEKRLHEGQSGSVVYAIKKGTEDLYVLGMLHGEKIRPIEGVISPTQEECFLVWPAINQALEKKYKGKAQFRLSGQDPTAVKEEDISNFDFETTRVRDYATRYGWIKKKIQVARRHSF